MAYGKQTQNVETPTEGLQGVTGGCWSIWRRAQPELLPPVPKACVGTGLPPPPCPFASSLLAPKQKQCLKRKEINQHRKITVPQLAETVSSVPQAFCQLSVGVFLAREAVEAYVSASVRASRGSRSMAAAISAGPHPGSAVPTSAPWPHHLCLAPPHAWLEENNRHFVLHRTMLFPLLSKSSCFSKANLASANTFNNGTYSD